MTAAPPSPRAQRVQLAKRVPPHGLFVELGVAQGRFAEEVLRTHSTLQYIGIDRWSDHHDEQEMQGAIARLDRFAGREPIIKRQTFSAAATEYPANFADAVYIDGYAHLGQDAGRTLIDWWPKVKPGGILAGHDYCARWPLTVKMVDAFAAGIGTTVEVIDDTPFPSWCITKGHTTRPVLDPDQPVCLVGNGPSVLKAEHGSRIDTFPEVIRFNAYQTAGFEKHSGTKTTLWSCYGANKIPATQPDKIIYLYGDNPTPHHPNTPVWRLPISFYHTLRSRVHAVSDWSAEAKARLQPSSGLMAAIWCLEMLNVQRLHFIGLDHFDRSQTWQHHYYAPNRYTAPREHDGQAEARLLSKYAQSGQLIPL
jgi:hypothetical protein